VGTSRYGRRCADMATGGTGPGWHGRANNTRSDIEQLNVESEKWYPFAFGVVSSMGSIVEVSEPPGGCAAFVGFGR
jgi:hypothetical protein